MNDLVSIVTPVCNSSAFIFDTVCSILGQDYPFFELLIVDDNSTDDTWRIVTDLSRLDKRIQCHRYNYSVGPAIARNTAIDKSTGRFIAFCDSDDIWHQNKLTSQLKLFDSRNVSIVFSPVLLIDETSAFKGFRNCPKRLTLSSLYYRNFIPCSSALYDTSLVGKVFMPNFSKRQDYGLWLSVLKEGYCALSCNDALVSYRVRSNSVSSNKLLASIYHFRVLKSCSDISLSQCSFYFLVYVLTSYFPFLASLFVAFDE